MTQKNGQVPEQDKTVVRRISEIGRIPVSETRAVKAVAEAQKIVASAQAQAQDGSRLEHAVAPPGEATTPNFPTKRDDSPTLARPTQSDRPMPKTIGEKLMIFKPFFATAAALLLGGVFLFSQNGTNQAFALEDIIASFRDARTGRYEMTVKVGEREHTQTVRFAPGVVRLDRSDRSLINNWKAGHIVELDHKARTARTKSTGKLEDLAPEARAEARKLMESQANPFNEFLDTLERAKLDSSLKVESLGEKTISGKTAVGHCVVSGSSKKTFWTEKSSGAPLLIEATPFGNAEKMTVSNCELDIDLNDSVFVPPAGYGVNEDTSLPRYETEAAFIGALKEVCKTRSGDFPDSISGQGYYDTMQAFKAKENSPETSFAVQQGLKFPNHVTGACYAGKGASSDEAARPIFWYPKDAGYRVIFADFSTKDVTEAPQHDAAVPIK